METIKVRYGESFDLKLESDDVTAQTVTLFVGKEGALPKITVPANFVSGIAFLEGTPDSTKIPLGEYKYQLTVTFSDGKVRKYPTAEDCEVDGLPDFVVLEALDETEVL